METYLVFVLLGLAGGAIAASLAQGVVISARGSGGAINFALAAQATWSAYAFQQMSTAGRYPLPPIPNPLALVEGLVDLVGGQVDLPDVPAFVDLGGPIAPGLAFVLGIGTALGVAVASDLLAFRWVRTSSTLTKVLISAGLLVLFQQIAVIRFGSGAVGSPALLPNDIVTVFGQRIPMDRLLIAGLAIASAVALSVFYSRSSFARRTTAGGENPMGAALVGVPLGRLASLNWMLATVLVSVFAMLFSSITALTPTSLTFVMIPALAAALAGRLTSFGWATGAALGFGVFQSVTTYWQSTWDWFPRQGVTYVVPFATIVILLVVKGRSLPDRSDVQLDSGMRIVRPPTTLVPYAAVGVACLIAVTILPVIYRSALITSLIAALVALSLVVIVGFAGQISLMQMAIAGAAALSMTQIAGSWGIPFPVAPLLAASVATVAGVLLASPALRLRGATLATVTLATGFVFTDAFLNNTSVLSDARRVESVPAATLGPLDLGVDSGASFGSAGSPSQAFCFMVIGIVTLAFCATVVVARSRTGRRWLAMRGNERAVAGCGRSVTRLKVQAMALASLLAGLAGTLSAYRFEGVNPASFGPLLSLSLLAVAFLGGIGHVWGACIAGLLVTNGLLSTFLDQHLSWGQYADLIGAIGLIVTVIVAPDGLAGDLESKFRLRRSVADAADAPPATNLDPTPAATS